MYISLKFQIGYECKNGFVFSGVVKQSRCSILHDFFLSVPQETQQKEILDVNKSHFSQYFQKYTNITQLVPPENSLYSGQILS